MHAMPASNVPVHKFKARLSHYLAQARAGKTIEIASHRKVVARVTGVADAEATGFGRLLAAGLAQWRPGKPKGAAFKLSAGGKNLSEMALEDR